MTGLTEPDRQPAAIANRLAREIKRRRLGAGLSQRKLAAQIGYTRQYVSMCEWEDASLPSAELVAAIDTAVGANGELVSMRAEAPDRRHRSRRISTELVAASERGPAAAVQSTAVVAAELDLDRAFDAELATSFLRSRSVSEATIDSFTAVTNLLAGQRQSIAPDALIGPIEAHRDAVATLFRAATNERVKQQVGALLGETSVVASRVWSAVGDRSMALTHCAFARKLADQLQDRAMSGIARIFESNLRSDAATLISSDGDVVIGLRILKEAAEFADCLPPAARARIGAEQAQAYAVLELREECEEALMRAQRAAEYISEGDRTGLFSDWNTTRIQVYVGTSQLLLNEPKRAIAALSSALNTKMGDSPNVELAARVDLASAYTLSGELEEGCRILGDAYGALAAMGNHRGIERANRAIERMSPWRNERPVLAMREKIGSLSSC
ncbi:helix-turn-helix domain-containing protein (plasmid) [Nocardia sp. NBC_01377]|uniref:helix-turn-helix domain-containing protein n=1 Tax=Nocardia sp. NBC_01377 TaxID=2903595 RepID=UPI002F90F052